MLSLITFTSTFSQRRTTPDMLGTYYPTIGVDISGGAFMFMNNPDSFYFNDGYIGKLRIGLISRFPLYKTKKLALGFGIYYDERAIASIKFNNFDTIAQINPKYITLFPYISLERLFVGINIGIPVSSKIHTSFTDKILDVDVKNMNLMIEPRIGSIISSIINNKFGWLNLNFSIGCSINEVFSHDIQICNSVFNGQTASVHLGLSWQFAIIPSDSTSDSTKIIQSGSGLNVK